MRHFVMGIALCATAGVLLASAAVGGEWVDVDGSIELPRYEGLVAADGIPFRGRARRFGVFQ